MQLEKEEEADSGATEEGTVPQQAVDTAVLGKEEEVGVRQTTCVGTAVESDRQITNRNAQQRESNANTAKEQVTTATCVNR